MQDKLFRVLLILSATVILFIGGGIVYSLTILRREPLKSLAFGILYSLMTGLLQPGKKAMEHYLLLPEHCLLPFLAFAYVYSFFFTCGSFYRGVFPGKENRHDIRNCHRFACRYSFYYLRSVGILRTA